MGRTGGGLIVRVILGLLPADNSGFPIEKSVILTNYTHNTPLDAV